MRAFWRRVNGDSQLRWLGPEKGVIHMAAGAVINAAWDLWARSEGKPLWKLLADLSPEETVAAIDFTYISDALSPDDALAILRRRHASRGEREAEMLERGFPAYTTSTGWLGYSDDKIRGLCRESLAEGWSHFKIKVGRDVEDDIRPVDDHPRGNRTGPEAHDGRESDLGRRRGDRVHVASRAIRSLVDRRTDESRRRPRARYDRKGSLPRSASPPESAARIVFCSNSSCRRTRFSFVRSTAAGSAV